MNLPAEELYERFYGQRQNEEAEEKEDGRREKNEPEAALLMFSMIS